MSEGFRRIEKGTAPRICQCGVVVYRGWKWSEDASQMKPVWLDCEQEGSVRPKQRIAGAGHLHVCKSKEKTA